MHTEELITDKVIIETMQKQGYRITEQRKQMIQLILEHDIVDPKEIYIEAKKRKISVGQATVYRIFHLMEQMGFLERRNYVCSHCGR